MESRIPEEENIIRDVNNRFILNELKKRNK